MSCFNLKRWWVLKRLEDEWTPWWRATRSSWMSPNHHIRWVMDGLDRLNTVHFRAVPTTLTDRHWWLANGGGRVNRVGCLEWLGIQLLTFGMSYSLDCVNISDRWQYGLVTFRRGEYLKLGKGPRLTYRLPSIDDILNVLSHSSAVAAVIIISCVIAAVSGATPIWVADPGTPTLWASSFDEVKSWGCPRAKLLLTRVSLSRLAHIRRRFGLWVWIHPVISWDPTILHLWHLRLLVGLRYRWSEAWCRGCIHKAVWCSRCLLFLSRPLAMHLDSLHRCSLASWPVLTPTNRCFLIWAIIALFSLTTRSYHEITVLLQLNNSILWVSPYLLLTSSWRWWVATFSEALGKGYWLGRPAWTIRISLLSRRLLCLLLHVHSHGGLLRR